MGFLGVKGPKQLLASAIATALNEYFEVDEKSVESNLLKDAKIVLRKVKLRPLTNTVKDFVVESTGCVEEVHFKWIWVIGNKDEKTWMKDVSLTISGLELNVNVDSRERDDNTVELDVTEQLPKNETDMKVNIEQKNEGRVQSYIRNQIEQIIDALTFILTDFKVNLVIQQHPNSSINDDISSFTSCCCGVVIGGSQLKLESLGRQGLVQQVEHQARSLSQRLGIESFYIDTFQCDNDQNERKFSPLLMPISYEAMATVHGGKRFGSIGRGLFFQGFDVPFQKDKIELDRASDVTFHLGNEQVKVICLILDLFLTRSSNRNEEVEEERTNENESMDNTSVEDQFEGLKQDVINCSVFKIPIGSISVILPNEVKMQLERFTINYCTDGETLRIEGTEGAGINFDDFNVISFKCNEDKGVQSFWQIDLVSRSFSIQNRGHDQNPITEVAEIKANPTVFKGVREGIMLLLKPVTDIVPMRSPSTNSEGKKLEENIDDSDSWLIDIQQNLRLVIEDDLPGGQGGWLHGNIVSVLVRLPLATSSCMNCDELIIGPTSYGQLLMKCPSVALHPETSVINADGNVSFHADSSATLNAVVTLLRSFESVLPRSNQTSHHTISSKKEGNREFHLKIPSVEVDLIEENLAVKLVGIQTNGKSSQCNSISIQKGNDFASTFQNLSLLLSPKMMLTVENIETVKVPGVVFLLEPILDAQITYHNNKVTMNLTKVVLLLPNEGKTKDEPDESRSKNSNVTLPIECIMKVGKLHLCRDDDKERKALLFLKGLCLDIDPNGTTRDVMQINVVSDEIRSHLFEVDTTNLSTELVQSEGENEIRNLRFSTEAPIKVYAGHSFSDWLFAFGPTFKRRQKEGNEATPLRLPLLSIAPLDIHVSYKFSEVSQTDTKVHTPAFNGDVSTTSNDLVHFYKTKVIDQIPGIVNDTEIFGINVVGTALFVGGYTLGAATTIAGVCGVDAIKSNLNAGRESRGAKKGDKYEVGDFFRGIHYSTSKLTKSGVEIRNSGKSVEELRKGDIIDYTVGASTQLQKYVKKKEAKLLGAGTAAVAMTVGTAMLGPAGLVAGAAVGALTEKLVEKNKSKHDSTDSLNAENESTHSYQESFRLVPQGLLYKRRDFFKTEWQARWFILDVRNKTLNYHLITKISPPKVDTNVLNFLSKPASNAEIQDCLDYKLEPVATLQLSKAKVSLNNKNSSFKHNMYSFTVVDEMNECWNLAATTEEARSIWMTMLMDLSDLNTYEEIIDIAK